MSATEPIVISAEQLAAHLAWRLSNSNTELDLPQGFLDVAFDTDRSRAAVTLSVSLWNAETRQRGFQTFTLTVTPAETGSAT